MSRFAEMTSTKEGKILFELISRAVGALISGFIVWLSVKSAHEKISFPKALLTGIIISIVGSIIF